MSENEARALVHTGPYREEAWKTEEIIHNQMVGTCRVLKAFERWKPVVAGGALWSWASGEIAKPEGAAVKGGGRVGAGALLGPIYGQADSVREAREALAPGQGQANDLSWGRADGWPDFRRPVQDVAASDWNTARFQPHRLEGCVRG